MSAPMTPEPMSNERIAEIEAREQAATPGPWTSSPKYPHVCWVGDDPGEQVISANLSERPAEDIVFIATARQDVPDLLDEVKRLNSAVRGGLSHVGAVLAERDTARAELAEERARHGELVAEMQRARKAADDARAEQVRLAEQVKRVRDRHPRKTDDADCMDADTTLGCQHGPGYHVVEYCGTCDDEWPCAEIRALDGTEGGCD